MGSIYRDGSDYTYGRIDRLWEGFLMELAIIWRVKWKKGVGRMTKTGTK